MAEPAIPLPEDGERALAEQREPVLRLLRDLADRLAAHDRAEPKQQVKEN